jgi:hypothetical protein
VSHSNEPMTFICAEVGWKLRGMRSLAQSSARNRTTVRTSSCAITQYALVMISEAFLIATRVLRMVGY